MVFPVRHLFRNTVSMLNTLPMKKYMQYAIPALLILMASCNAGQVGEMAKADEAAVTTTADTAAVSTDGVLKLDDPARKIIKTADMCCRVKDVFTATSGTEQLVMGVGGQVMESSMENQSSETKLLPYTTDSVKQVQTYTTTAHLTLKIPVQKLDTVLGVLAGQAAFIHSRNRKLEDVTFQYLGNKMMTDAMKETNTDEQAMALARKTNDVITAGDYTEGRKEKAISRRLENSSILDQVAYATVRVDLYQPERMDVLILPDMNRLGKPSFCQQLGTALNGGWQLLQQLLVMLVYIWPLLLAGIVVLVWFRRRKQFPVKMIAK